MATKVEQSDRLRIGALCAARIGLIWSTRQGRRRLNARCHKQALTVLGGLLVFTARRLELTHPFNSREPSCARLSAPTVVHRLCSPGKGDLGPAALWYSR